MNQYATNLKKRSCRICGNSTTELLSKKMRPGPQLVTVICNQCSLVFTDPVPTQEVYYSFYANDYEKHYGKSTASQPITVVPDFFKKLKEFIDPKELDFLEIGPGRGNVIFHAATMFKSVLGVEPSEKFASYLTNVLNIPTLNTTGEEFFKTNTNLFDVVSMFHVLEHIYDPTIALADIHKLLNKDGILIIEVPNVFKPFRDADFYFLRFVHLFNFSPFSLSNLLKKNGFEILYLNDGGNEWNKPENILVFARKIEDFEFNLDTTPAQKEVTRLVETWTTYRKFYRETLQSKWLILDLKKTIKTQLRKIVRPIKRLLKG